MINVRSKAASILRDRSRLSAFLTTTLFLIGCMLIFTGCARQQTIIFADHLDDRAVTVDGQDYALRDTGFYVAYLEETVQQAALVYEPNDTNQFWNLHMNKFFLRVRTRDEAINMAVHDFIFLEMAREWEMELDEDEMFYADSRMDDFWMDIGEKAHEKLGLSYEELQTQIRNMALAQKAQQLYSMMENREYEDYDMSGWAYQKMLEDHEVSVNRAIWDGLSFGHVTVSQ